MLHITPHNTATISDSGEPQSQLNSPVTLSQFQTCLSQSHPPTVNYQQALPVKILTVSHCTFTSSEHHSHSILCHWDIFTVLPITLMVFPDYQLPKVIAQSSEKT